MPEYLAPGVQYVLDHAGSEAERFGLTPESIADKIVAQLGLKNMETNLAITAAATPVTSRMGVTAPVVAGPMARHWRCLKSDSSRLPLSSCARTRAAGSDTSNAHKARAAPISL